MGVATDTACGARGEVPAVRKVVAAGAAMSMLTIDKGAFEAEAIAAMCRSSILVRCENST